MMRVKERTPGRRPRTLQVPQRRPLRKRRICWPRCGKPIQRIRYAGNEANYCPHCQTGGKLLADRALSRLLRDDWPKTLEQLETMVEKRRTT